MNIRVLGMAALTILIMLSFFGCATGLSNRWEGLKKTEEEKLHSDGHIGLGIWKIPGPSITWGGAAGLFGYGYGYGFGTPPATVYVFPPGYYYDERRPPPSPLGAPPAYPWQAPSANQSPKQIPPETKKDNQQTQANQQPQLFLQPKPNQQGEQPYYGPGTYNDPTLISFYNRTLCWVEVIFEATGDKVEIEPFGYSGYRFLPEGDWRVVIKTWKQTQAGLLQIVNEEWIAIRRWNRSRSFVVGRGCGGYGGGFYNGGFYGGGFYGGYP